MFNKSYIHLCLVQYIHPSILQMLVGVLEPIAVSQDILWMDD